MTHFALVLQARFRTFYEQRRHSEVATAIKQLHLRRRQEGEVAIAVRFQSLARTHLATLRFRAAAEYAKRLRDDQVNAAIVLQSVGRMFGAKLRLYV